MNVKPKEKFEAINIRVSAREKRRLEAAAKKWAGGNLSLWLRTAGVAFRPLRKLSK